MNTYARVGVAAAIAVVLVGGGIALFRPGASSGVGTAPGAAASIAPSVAPSVAPSPDAGTIGTADWVPFTSPQYGYQISYPRSHTGVTGSTVSAPTEVAPTHRDFVIGTNRLTEDAPVDWFVLGPDGDKIAVGGFAATVPDGMSVDELLDATFGPCPSGRTSEAITVDGHPGRLDVAAGCEVSSAVVVVGDRAWVFMEWHGKYKELLKAFLSTVRLPISTDGWQSFTSGRYGYTAAYPPTSTGMPGSTTPAPTEATPASRDWSLERDGKMFTTIDTFDQAVPATDLLVLGPDGDQIAITGFAAPVPAGTSEDDWIATYNRTQNRPASCGDRIPWQPVTVDGVAGRLDPCGDAQAFVFRDGRVYVFSVWQPNQVVLLEAFLRTVSFDR